MDFITLFKHFLNPLLPYVGHRERVARRYEFSRRPEWLSELLLERAVERRGRQSDFRHKQAFGGPRAARRRAWAK
jgi:hypothetical protein